MLDQIQETMNTSWMGFALAAVLWVCVRAWRIFRTGGKVSDETRLYNFLRDSLSNPNLWTVADNGCSVETLSAVVPKIQVYILSTTPGATINGDQVADIISRRKLKKLARMGCRVKALKEDAFRQARIAKITSLIQITNQPARQVANQPGQVANAPAHGHPTLVSGHPIFPSAGK